MTTTGWKGPLDANEKILWQGQPDGHFRLRAKNIVISVFGCFFLGVSVFGMLKAHSAAPSAAITDLLFLLLSLPFIVIGFYMVIGIHWADALERGKTRYTLTNKRAVISTNFRVKRLKSYPIGVDTVLDLRPGTPGSIMFAQDVIRTRNGTSRRTIGFDLIPDAEKLYQLFRSVQKGQPA